MKLHWNWFIIKFELEACQKNTKEKFRKDKKKEKKRIQVTKAHDGLHF